MNRDDTGSGTVVVLCGVLVVVLAAMVATALGAVIVTRARAAAAADAAALAAARLVTLQPQATCTRAAAVARADGAGLDSCRVTNSIVDVTVEVPAPPWLTWAGAARLNARAGPAETYQEQLGRAGGAS